MFQVPKPLLQLLKLVMQLLHLQIVYAIYVPRLEASRGAISKISTPFIFPKISNRSRPVACSRSVGMLPIEAPVGRRSASFFISTFQRPRSAQFLDSLPLSSHSIQRLLLFCSIDLPPSMISPSKTFIFLSAFGPEAGVGAASPTQHVRISLNPFQTLSITICHHFQRNCSSSHELGTREKVAYGERKSW